MLLQPMPTIGPLPVFTYEPVEDCYCGAAFSGAKTIRKQVIGNDIYFRCCEACGSWTQSPRLSDQSLNSLFNSDRYFGTAEQPGLVYSNYIADESARQSEAYSRLRHDLVPLMRRPDARVLEVGCASASLLAACRNQGWTVKGIDWSQQMVDAARTLNGIDVIKSDPLEIDFPPDSFDLIMLFGTFGNLRHPRRYLERFHRWLSPTGRLAFNYVDSGAFFVKYAYGERCWMFTPSINFFATTKAVRALLEQTGFDNVNMHQDWQQPSLGKLLHHARLGWLAESRWLHRLKNSPLPIRLPLPSIRFVSCSPKRLEQP